MLGKFVTINLVMLYVQSAPIKCLKAGQSPIPPLSYLVRYRQDLVSLSLKL